LGLEGFAVKVNVIGEVELTEPESGETVSQGLLVSRATVNPTAPPVLVKVTCWPTMGARLLSNASRKAVSWLRMVSPGTVLFRQERMGRNGRFFTLYKFRTMRPGAERDLPTLMALNQMNGAMFKMQNDPRVIFGGDFMRRTHLDELPQFWNVLMGDMSLVGTRPPTRNEVVSYENRHHRRLSMRPGITGMWQVAGNHAVSDFEEVVKLDCHYIDHWSLGLDLKLIGKTLLKVTRRIGW